MPQAAQYSAVETLRNGRRLIIRALRPDDRADFLAAVERASGQSLYRRFFGAKRGFTSEEEKFFLEVDFVKHVALVAVLEEADRPAIIAGGRYVVIEPAKAEVAFVVIDQYQGQGIGTALLRHLARIATQGGINEFVAEVLPENRSMLKVFEKSGFVMGTKRDGQVVHVTLRMS
jgi:RimJ/RimL family protein N-acetyltransferase